MKTIWVANLTRLLKRARPKRETIFKFVASLIHRGHLEPGERLPSTRELARRVRVSRQTVIEAYDDLAAHGLVTGVHGSGTYVKADGRAEGHGTAPVL